MAPKRKRQQQSAEATSAEKQESSVSIGNEDIQAAMMVQENEDEAQKEANNEVPDENEPPTKLRKKNDDVDVKDAKETASNGGQEGEEGDKAEEEKSEDKEEEAQEEEEEEEAMEEEEEAKDDGTGQPKQVVKRPKAPGQDMAPKKPMNDKEAEQAIAEFMEKQNRPYSVQNILDSFQQRIKKTQCQKIMDDLTASQILTCKEYGKAKIYLINQDLFQTTTNDELVLLDEQIKVRRDEFEELSTQLKQLQNQLKEASQGMTNTDIENDIKQHNRDIKAAKAQIEPFKTGGRKLITQAEINKGDQALKKFQMEWKKRKRACMDVVDTISDSVDMNRKDFIKKIGIDTDEENRVVCPL